MHRDEFEKTWPIIKELIPEKWGRFTKEEMVKMSGKYDQFLMNLQKKYHLTRDEADQEMQNWLGSDEKKKPSIRGRLPLGGEESIADIKKHEELVHEDREPTYPFQPIEGQNPSKKKDEGHKK